MIKAINKKPASPRLLMCAGFILLPMIILGGCSMNDQIGGAGAEVDTMEINFIICIGKDADYPPHPGEVYVGNAMLGEIKMFAGDFAPEGWAFCEGQLMDIKTNVTLASILKYTYGGDQITTFALPDLRGKVVVHSN